MKIMKRLLEIYGLVKLILGLTLLVALSGGYFLTEWTVKYPTQIYQYVINKQIITLVYIAVIFRSIFHCVAGIGIARLKDWVGSWLFFGWPIIVILTGGVSITLYSDWRSVGYVTQVTQIFAWPQIFVYVGIILLDLSIIRKMVDNLSSSRMQQKWGEPLKPKYIWLVAFSTILFFSVLLFWGKPVSQGFHKGYYKIKGERSDSAARIEVIGGDKVIKKNETLKVGLKEEGDKKSLKRTELAKISKEHGKENFDERVSVPEVQATELDLALSYTKIIGIIIGIGSILAMLFQLAEVYNAQQAHDVSLTAYVIYSLVFFLGVILGIAENKFFLVLFFFVMLIIALGIMFLKVKYARESEEEISVNA